MTSTKSRTPRRRFFQLLAPLLAFMFLAAACGDDGDDDSTSDTTDETTETTEAADDAAETTETTEAADDSAETTETTAAAAGGGGENVVTVACGEDSSFATPSEAVTELTVAVVAPSASQDLAFTQSMIDSLAALGIEPQITDGSFVVEEAAAAIRGYAESGVDVVIAHGTQYGGSLVEIAPDFPETSFLWGTSSDTQGLENVFAYTPAADEGGYVLGTVAAAISESGTIGMVGPVEAGDAKLYVDGFVAGAESAGGSVNVTYTGSFGDVQLATEAATAQVGVGADVLTGTAQHVVGAINIAATNEIPWFGTQSNQVSLAPELVVASQVYHWEVILAEIFAEIEGGTLGGEVFELTLANNGLVLEFNDCYDLPQELKDGAVEVVAGIADGSVSTGA